MSVVLLATSAMPPQNSHDPLMRRRLPWLKRLPGRLDRVGQGLRHRVHRRCTDKGSPRASCRQAIPRESGQRDRAARRRSAQWCCRSRQPRPCSAEDPSLRDVAG